MVIKIKKNINVLKDTIKIIENINPEIDFVFCPEGIIVKAIDPPAVSIGIFKIKKEMFEEYEVSEQKVCKFDVKLLGKILKKFGKNELTIEFEEDRVKFITVTDTFTLKFFVGQDDERPEPMFEGTSKWTIDPNEFFLHIKDLADFNEIIKFENKEDTLYMGTKSTLLEGTTRTNSVSHENIDSKCWYSLTNFTMIAPIQKIFEHASFEYGNDSPCMITANNDYLKFKWVLAPRIEE